MHAIKGGWVGQTFALASSDDAGGKKSRIRHSKEERKMMVESFIKKYLKLNDGNFPSVNLAHNEVGGSFYTASSSSVKLISEDSTAVGIKSSGEDKKGLKKGSSPVLERINLETWEGASKKSTRSTESNPLLTLVKAFISAFVKL